MTSPRRTDWEVNTWLKYCGYEVGLGLCVLIIPSGLLLVMHILVNPYNDVWNYLILIYIYFAGVFCSDRLCRYWKKVREEYEAENKKRGSTE